MVFTKRMKSARMNQSCCWNGGSSAGLVGKPVKTINSIKTRAQVSEKKSTEESSS